MKRMGFTLIELLIVVAIIGILAAIAVPNFLNAQIRSKIARCEADLNGIRTALLSYRMDANAYPPITQNPGYAIPKNLTTPIAYMSSIPLDVFPSNLDRDQYAQYLTTEDYYFATADYFKKYNWLWMVRSGVNGHYYEFNLMGRGPDGVWALKGSGNLDVDEPLKWRYDSSNGLVSLGNVPFPGP